MAMARVIPAERLVPVEEYLRTSYSPDCDFVDGRVEERNLGEYEHSKVQGMIARLLGNREAEWGIETVVECRLQVSAQRFRVPDVMVLRGGLKVERIVRDAPLVCIEVLSPEDTWKRMREKVEDYLRMGTEHIWVFDPDAREVHRYDKAGFHRVSEAELAVAGTPIVLSVAEVFAALPAK